MICGWISPEGKIYQCGYMEHLDMAYDLCAEIGIPVGVVPDEELVKHGWIKVYYSVLDYQTYLYSGAIITEAQKLVLREDYEKNPQAWHKLAIYEMEELGVLEPWYDADGFRIPRVDF